MKCPDCGYEIPDEPQCCPYCSREITAHQLESVRKLREETFGPGEEGVRAMQEANREAEAKSKGRWQMKLLAVLMAVFALLNRYYKYKEPAPPQEKGRVMSEELRGKLDRFTRDVEKLYKEGRIEEAVALCDGVVASNPKDLELVLNAYGIKALSLAALKKNDEAIAVSQQAIRLSPADPSSWLVRARVLLPVGRLDEAESCLGECERLDRVGALKSHVESCRQFIVKRRGAR